jgi:hypothetical protein
MMSLLRAVPWVSILALLMLVAVPLQAKEYKVDCASIDDCMTKGNNFTKQRKLSLALEAYRNAIKLDTDNQDAWRKFEMMVVRIAEEGGC